MQARLLEQDSSQSPGHTLNLKFMGYTNLL